MSAEYLTMEQGASSDRFHPAAIPRSPAFTVVRQRPDNSMTSHDPPP